MASGILRQILAKLLIAICVMVLPIRSFGAILNLKDLEEQCFQADDIIEGRRGTTGVDVEVLAVYSGALKPGQHIVVEDLRYYVKPSGSKAQVDAIHAGDRFFLLLERSQRTTPAQAQGMQNLFSVVPAGVKIVVRGRMCDSLYSRDFQLLTRPYYADPGAPSVGGYRAALKQSIANVAPLRSRFAAPLSAGDGTWLVNLVRHQPSRLWALAPDRSLTSQVIYRLLQLSNPAALDQAIEASPSIGPALASGFATIQGCEYLLEKISDRSISAKHRIALIEAFEAASVARDESDGVAAHSFTSTSPIRKPYLLPLRTNNPIIKTHSLSRAAKLAASDGMPPEAVERLVRWIMWIVTTFDSADMQEEVQPITDALRDLHRRPTTNERVRFEIEKAVLALGRAGYRSLEPKGGPIVSMPLIPDDGIVSPFFVLIVFQFITESPMPIGHIDLMVEPIPPRENSVIAAATVPWTQNQSYYCAYVSPSVLPGRYRAFLRFYDQNDQLVSEGHSAELTVIGLATFPPGLAAVGPPNLPPAQQPPKPWLPPQWLAAVQNWSDLIIIAAVALLILGYFLRSRRRTRLFKAGKCIHCGYDLRATSGRCPECGNAPPAFLQMSVLRRRVYVACSAALALICVMTLVLWVRSHWVSDCIINSTPLRADAYYGAAGALVLEQPCVRSEAGWTYERDDPAEMVRTPADAGVAPDWRFLGAQRAADIGITVIPFWQIAVVTSLLSCGFWRLSRAMRSTVPAPAKMTT